MLTNTDLAIVRAALQFLDEEFSPNEDKLFQHYLDDQGISLGVSLADIKPARKLFEKSNLFYAKKKRGINELESVDLVRATAQDELTYMADRVELVSVLTTSS